MIESSQANPVTLCKEDARQMGGIIDITTVGFCHKNQLGAVSIDIIDMHMLLEQHKHTTD